MPNPIDTGFPKRCPKCTASCEKFYMFQTDWYWRCPKCKIDADSVPQVSVSVKPVKAWDDEMTDPNYRIIQSHLYDANNCRMTSIMVSTDPLTGLPTADLKITAAGVKSLVGSGFHGSGAGRVEQFSEVFEVTPGCPGGENDLWEEIAIRLLKLPFALNHREIKVEYLKSRLMQRYPSDKIVVS